MARLILHIDSLGYSVKVPTEGGWTRCLDEQKRFVCEGKSKTMNSLHLEGRATDLVLFKNGRPIFGGEEFRALGEFWESLGAECKWGGRFHNPERFLAEHGRDFDPEKDIGFDPPHFETRML